MNIYFLYMKGENALMPKVDFSAANNDSFLTSGNTALGPSSYGTSSIDIFNTQNAYPTNSVFGNSSTGSATSKQIQHSLGSTGRADREIKQAEEDAQKEKEKLAQIQKQIKKLEKQISEENRADEPNEGRISDLKLQLSKLKAKERTTLNSYQRSLSDYKNASRSKEFESLSTSNLQTNWLQSALTSAGNTLNNAKNSVQTAFGMDSNISVPNSEKASMLANAAEGVANSMGGPNSTGWCYRGVINSLEKIGVTGLSGGSAYMAADQLAKRSDFQEITGNYPSGKSLQNLPAGAVVVWDKGVNGYSPEHGHISIALGDGREASDFVGRQGGANYEGSTGYRVFLPATKDAAPTTASASAQGLIGTAAKEIGVKETSTDDSARISQYRGYSAANAWCASFVSWCMDKSYGSKNPLKHTEAVAGIMEQAQNAGAYGTRGSYTPKSGDIICFKGGSMSHTGIVEKVENGRVYIIDGNSSNQVKRNSYSLTDGNIHGYAKVEEWSRGARA